MVSFANAAMLAGLVALGLPLLLHLMKRQQAVTLVFPSIRFLRRSQLPQAGRRKLRDIPLLLLRLLLFLLLVLVFAQPLWAPEEAAEKGAPARVSRQVLLLDVSASMAAGEVMEAARRSALDALAEASPGTPSALLLSAGRVLEVHGTDTPASHIRRAIRKATPTVLAGEHGDALRQAAKMLPEGGRGRLVIISDFQSSDWGALSLAPLPPGTAVDLLPLSPPESANWAILSARARAAGPDQTLVQVRLRSFANAERMLDLQLVSAGRVLAERAVALPARSIKTVELVAAHFASPEGLLRIPEDGYAPDNQFHVWLGARPPPKVLLVAPFAELPEVQTDVFFLRQALALGSGGGERGYAVEQADAQFLFALDPAAYSGILLVRAAGFLNREALEKVRRFIVGGGCVLSFPGARAAAGMRGLTEQGLLDARYRGLAQPDPPPTVNRVRGKPLKDVFREGKTADLFLTQLFRYARMDAGPAAEVLVSAGQGVPVVLRQSTQRGTVIAFAVPPSPEWTDLPVRLSFVPLLHELLQSALPQQRAVGQLSCGEAPPPPATLLEDNDEQAQVPDTSTPGIVKYAGRPLAVNVARSESDPAQASLAALRARLTEPAAAESNPATTAVATGTPASRARPLWPWIAGVAALLMLLETALAQRVSDDKEAINEAKPTSQAL